MSDSSAPETAQIEITRPRVIIECAKGAVEVLIERVTRSVLEHVHKQLTLLTKPEDVFLDGSINPDNLSIRKVFSHGLYEAAMNSLKRKDEEIAVIPHLRTIYHGAAMVLVSAGWDVVVDMKDVNIPEGKYPELTLSYSPDDSTEGVAGEITMIDSDKKSQKD